MSSFFKLFLNFTKVTLRDLKKCYKLILFGIKVFAKLFSKSGVLPVETNLNFIIKLKTVQKFSPSLFQKAGYIRPKLIERALFTLFIEPLSSSPIRSFRRFLSMVLICSRRTTLSLARPHPSALSSICVGSFAFSF